MCLRSPKRRASALAESGGERVPSGAIKERRAKHMGQKSANTCEVLGETFDKYMAWPAHASRAIAARKFEVIAEGSHSFVKGKTGLTACG